MSRDWDLANDPDLLNGLFGSIISKAQTAAPPLPKPETGMPNVLEVAQRLARSLVKKMTPQPDKVEFANEVSVKSGDIRNLDSFIKFLFDNKGKFNGQQIVYGPGEPAPTGENFEPITSGGVQYNVNIPAIQGYIGTLNLKFEEQKKLPRYATQANVNANYLANLAADLGKRTDRQIEVKKPAAQPVLPDNTRIAGFDSPVLYLDATGKPTKIPTRDSLSGPVVLTAGDLKNRSSLINWLEKYKFTVVNGNTQQDWTENPGVVMSFLLQYAQKLNSLHTEANEKQLGYFENQMTQIAPTFAAATGGQAQQTQAPQGKAFDSAMLETANLEVFAFGDIDLGRFTEFLNQCSKIMNDADTVQLIAQARKSIDGAKSQTKGRNITVFTMQGTMDEFTNLAEGPQYLPWLLQQLLSAVQFTGLVYKNFYNRKGRQIAGIEAGGEAALNNMSKQIYGSGSAYQSNIIHLGELTRQVQTKKR